MHSGTFDPGFDKNLCLHRGSCELWVIFISNEDKRYEDKPIVILIYVLEDIIKAKVLLFLSLKYAKTADLNEEVQK